MIARFASLSAVAGILMLGVPAGTALAQGYGSAASTAATLGATASPPTAGRYGFAAGPSVGDGVVAAPLPDDVLVTGSIGRTERHHARPHRR